MTLALGFGQTQAAAVSTAGASLGRSFAAISADYQLGWLRYDVGLKPIKASLPGVPPAQRLSMLKQYYLSANVVKASEDKTYPGAIVASLASPWGQAVSAGDSKNTYFGSYREVFARDLYQAFSALLVDGDLTTARDTARFLLLRQQQPDGSIPRNSLVNGKPAPDSFNNQLDEDALPAPHGAAVRPRRRRRRCGRTRRRRRTTSPPTARPPARSGGRSRAGTRRRRSRRRSPVSSPPATIAQQQRRRRATPARGSPPPISTSAASRAGR